MIDLHTHTTASDGTFSFEELINEAERVGLKAIAITDHDNIESAKKIGKPTSPVELIAGVELTISDMEFGYSDIHILGQFIDTKHKTLNSKLASLAVEREKQKISSVEKLRELGYDIAFEEVKRDAKGVVGRPHIARALMKKYPDEFPSIEVVFVRLLGRGKKAYVEREAGFGLKEAVDLIHSAGGLSFVAHPYLYPYESKKLLSDFRDSGGDGAEVYYDYAGNAPGKVRTKEENGKIMEKYRMLASEIGLLECGGSDFHGENKKQKLGEYGAPDEVLGKLKQMLNRLRS
jgi:hypothetical protein